MNTLFKRLPIILFPFVLGCGHFTSPATQVELDPTKSYWFHYSADRRGAFILNGNTQLRTCSEPSPDVANKMAEKIELKAKSKGVEASVAAELNQDIVKLTERTQMILYLREALFRLCELSLNSNLTDDKKAELYTLVLRTSESMTRSDANFQETRKLRAAVKLEETLKGSYLKDIAGDRLRKFWKPDGKTINKENESKIEGWIKQNLESQVSIISFIRSRTFREERAKAVKELILLN